MSQSITDLTRFASEYGRIADLPENEQYRLLSSERRREVLDILTERTFPLDLDELAVEVADQEELLDPSDETDTERVAISLHHQHLPKMADVGLLQYDADSHRIEP